MPELSVHFMIIKNDNEFDMVFSFHVPKSEYETAFTKSDVQIILEFTWKTDLLREGSKLPILGQISLPLTCNCNASSQKLLQFERDIF